jgi:integrase
MGEGKKSLWASAKPRKRSLKASETMPYIMAARHHAAEAKPHRAGAYRLLELLALTGLRFAEGAELRWDEVDLADAALRIGANRMKAKAQFDKPLGKAAVEVLRAQHAASGGGVFVFPSPTKPAVPIDDARGAMTAVCRSIGTTITPHDLRRTFIRAAEAAGLPHSRIKALVAHTVDGTDVTSGYLGDGFNDDPHRDAQRVEDFLLGART